MIIITQRIKMGLAGLVQVAARGVLLSVGMMNVLKSKKGKKKQHQGHEPRKCFLTWVGGVSV